MSGQSDTAFRLLKCAQQKSFQQVHKMHLLVCSIRSKNYLLYCLGSKEMNAETLKKGKNQAKALSPKANDKTKRSKLEGGSKKLTEMVRHTEQYEEQLLERLH